MKQYDDLIRFLKENGALLNTIRPYLLLSFSDYQLYCKTTSADYPCVQQKFNELAFTYLSNDAWIQLFYQCIRVFYLVRVQKSMLKTVPNSAAQHQTI